MSLLGGMAAASNALQLGGSAVSLLGATKTLITGPKTPPGITGPNYSVDGAFAGFIPGGFIPSLSRPQTSYLFDIPLTDALHLKAQITDHFTETNYFIQDHIGIEPVRITLTGLASELVFSKNRLEKYIQQVLSTLGPLGVLTPEQSASAQQYLAGVEQLGSAVGSAIDSINSTLGTLGFGNYRNKQQRAYDQFQSWFYNRAVLSVETPWDTFDSMVIEELSFEQDESSTETTTVSVTFKEIRTASTETNTGPLKGRIVSQLAGKSDKGNSKGKAVDQSIALGGAKSLGVVQ
jgi:hypothetical protein